MLSESHGSLVLSLHSGRYTHHFSTCWVSWVLKFGNCETLVTLVIWLLAYARLFFSLSLKITNLCDFCDFIFPFVNFESLVSFDVFESLFCHFLWLLVTFLMVESFWVLKISFCNILVHFMTCHSLWLLSHLSWFCDILTFAIESLLPLFSLIPFLIR